LFLSTHCTDFGIGGAFIGTTPEASLRVFAVQKTLGPTLLGPSPVFIHFTRPSARSHCVTRNTVYCFLVFQETNDNPSSANQPVNDLRVKGQLAQFES